MKFIKFCISIIVLISIFSLIVSKPQNKQKSKLPKSEKQGQQGGCCGQMNAIYNSITKQVEAISKTDTELSKKVDEQQITTKKEINEIGKLLDEIKLNTKNLYNEVKRKDPVDYAVSVSKILRDKNDFFKIKGNFF